jgi:hypothetical protein
MPLTADLRNKIGRLLLMQMSSHVGEREAALAAVTRMLERNNLTWHDLVAELTGPQPQPQAQQEAYSTSTWKRTTGTIDLPRGQLIELLQLIEAKSPFLSIKAREFLDTLRSHAFRPTVHLTERQWNWLQDLVQQTGL